MPVAANSGFIAQRLAQGLAEANPHVFHRVVLIDMEIAGSLDAQIESGMFGQQDEHVIEEPDAGGRFASSAAVEREFQIDRRLGRFCVGFARYAT